MYATTQLFATNKFTIAPMKAIEPCSIEPVAKRRDGGTRFWCLTHRADATAKYGKPADKCRAADIPPLKPTEIHDLDLADFKGGVAMWGAVPAVYDTTRLPMDRGIHLHARRSPEETKEIDATFRAVRLKTNDPDNPNVLIEEIDAIYYMVSSIFGFDMAYVCCTHCSWPHLDKDFFSVRPHRRHLCAGCGRNFNDTRKAIGNPIVGVQSAGGFPSHQSNLSKRTLRISQSDYPGGIQIWGSNSAFVWTSNAAEESGIHVHAYKRDGNEPVVDDTFKTVEIDGVELDANQVRMLMAQNVMPSLNGRIQSVVCSSCGESHIDEHEAAYTPSSDRNCQSCETQLHSRGRYRKVVSNPIVNSLTKLAESAVREPQQHRLNLLAETL